MRTLLVLLILIGLPIAVIVAPMASADVREAIAPYLCSDKQTLETRAQQYTDSRGSGTSFTLVCREASGREEHDVTWKLMLVFFPLLGLDILLLIRYFTRSATRGMQGQFAQPVGSSVFGSSPISGVASSGSPVIGQGASSAYTSGNMQVYTSGTPNIVATSLDDPALKAKLAELKQDVASGKAKLSDVFGLMGQVTEAMNSNQDVVGGQANLNEINNIFGDMTNAMSANKPSGSAFNFDASTPHNTDLTEKLRELKEALDAGLITQSEFDRKRKDILDKFS